MPELRAYYGYPLTLASCVVVTLGMLIYFRKKRWIGKWIDRRRADAEAEARADAENPPAA
jgi:hypothetical protein